MSVESVPLVVEFVSGSWLRQEQATLAPVPALHEELPGLTVVLPDGRKLPMPAEQVVYREEREGSVRLGFGGMSFEGMEEGRFVFWRVRDLLPEERMPAAGADKVLLEASAIARIHVRGTQVWPRG